MTPIEQVLDAMDRHDDHLSGSARQSSQQRLAQALGITSQAISRWKKYRDGQIPLYHIVLVSEISGVSRSDLDRRASDV